MKRYAWNAHACIFALERSGTKRNATACKASSRAAFQPDILKWNAGTITAFRSFPLSEGKRRNEGGIRRTDPCRGLGGKGRDFHQIAPRDRCVDITSIPDLNP